MAGSTILQGSSELVDLAQSPSACHGQAGWALRLPDSQNPRRQEINRVLTALLGLTRASWWRGSQGRGAEAGA